MIKSTLRYDWTWNLLAMGRFLLFPPPGCSTGGGALRHLSQWLGEKISVVWGISHASKERERERERERPTLQWPASEAFFLRTFWFTQFVTEVYSYYIQLILIALQSGMIWSTTWRLLQAGCETSVTWASKAPGQCETPVVRSTFKIWPKTGENTCYDC